MRKRRVLIIFALILMLSQILFLHDRVLAAGEKPDETEKAFSEIQVEQISEAPEESTKDKDEEKVQDSLSESDETITTDQSKPQKNAKKEQKKEPETENEIELKTEPNGIKVHNLKKYSGYLVVVFLIFVILLCFIIYKKRSKKKNNKIPSTDSQEMIGTVYLVNQNERIAIPVRKKVKSTIGSKGKADIALDEDAELADIHMTLWHDQGRYWIEKQQTEKPLKFNGRELKKGEIRALYNHAVLEIGNTRYWFTDEEG